MHKIKDLKAGDFLDLENYFKEITNEDYTNLDKFYLLLLDRVPTKEADVLSTIELFINDLTDIKETYYWIYTPPEMPSDAEQKEPSIGDEYRQEFAEDYAGYTEMIYLICKGDFLKINEVMQMKTQDFLYWGEYLLRKRFVENIK